MAISNTSILIKRSSTTANPGTLKSGELAYSYVSNTLYFGTVGGNGTVNIGGQYYTSTIEAATDANTAGTLVKRDVNGAFSGNLLGHSSNTYALINAQNFSISGGDISASAQSFDGTGAVTLNASLNSVAGLSAGSYGSTTAIPVIGVSANGRVTSISTSAISTSFNISDTVNSNTINGGATFYFQKGGGVTTTVSANTVTFDTDRTVLRSNTSSVGVQTISTDVTIAGNLVINGTTTTINTATVSTNDSLIKLASNNIVSDIVDIGFYGQSNTGSITYHGLIREGSGGVSAGNFFLFKDLGVDPTGNTVNYASLTKASLIADLSLASGYPTANLTGLGAGVATFLATPSSANFAAALTDETGTGSVVFSNNASLVSPDLTTPTIGVAKGTSLNVTSGLVSTGAWSGTFHDGVVLDYVTGEGRISVGGQDGFQFYSNTEIARTPLLTIAANNSLSNATWMGSIVSVPFGGTGTSFFTPGSILVGNGSGTLSTLTNTSIAITGSASQSNTITSVTVDAYGRTTALTYSEILGLRVSQGGTGVSSFTANGITYGNGTGAMQVTAAAGTSDQTWSNQILTVTNAGVPTWSSALDGGTF